MAHDDPVDDRYQGELRDRGACRPQLVGEPGLDRLARRLAVAPKRFRVHLTDCGLVADSLSSHVHVPMVRPRSLRVVVGRGSDSQFPVWCDGYVCGDGRAV